MRPGVLAIVVATAFVIGAAETLVWLGARGIMTLGGFVATGGPYVIAHEAPGWVWVLPVSIVSLVIAMQTSKGLSDSHDTPSLMLLAWSALFLTMGVNFLDFGLRSPSGGIAIGWLICAPIFFAMGGGGIYAFVQSLQAQRELDEQKAERTGTYPVRPGFRGYQIASGVAVVAGIAAGWILFGLLGA